MCISRQNEYKLCNKYTRILPGFPGGFPNSAVMNYMFYKYRIECTSRQCFGICLTWHVDRF